MTYELHVHIYFASRTRWAHFEKTLEMPAVPRVGESIRFCHPDLGDFVSWRVSEVTHQESGPIDVSTSLLENLDNRMYSFEFEAEWDDYYSAFTQAGWDCALGVRPNILFLERPPNGPGHGA